MKEPTWPPHLIRFGNFELDTRAGELRKGAGKVRLGENSLRVLLALLERPGEVVTREELRRKLWPADTFVDFEDGLNHAVRKLREALGDDAETPSYMETVPRRGYRFIRPVSTAGAELAPARPLYAGGEPPAAPAPAGATVPLAIPREELSERGSRPEGTLGTVAPRHFLRWLWAAGAAALLTLAASLYLLRGRPAIDSLAVLPFASTGSGANTEYLSDGLAEQLINSLSQFPQLRVIARTTAFTYKGKPIDLAKVGKDLRVRAVLMGKVVERADSLTVQVDLVRTEDGSELWGRQFHGDASDLQAVEEEIARQVSDKLRVRLSGEEQERLTKRYTQNPEAYNLYLQGRYLLDEVAPESVVKSRAYFEQAIAKDPNYALVHAGLADSYTYAWINELEPPDRAIPKAREEALKAIQLDGSAGEGHISLGIIKLFYDWDWSGAERELRRGGELSPNSPYVRHWYAHYLEVTGRMPEANARMLEILDTDPLSPMILEDVFQEYIWTHQWGRALKAFERLAPLYPNDPTAIRWMPLLYERLGRHEEALAALEKLRAAPRSLFISEFVVFSLAKMGQRAEAEKVLASLKEAEKNESPPDYVLMGYIRFALGDFNEGFAYLDRAYAARDQGINRQELAFMNPVWWLEDSRHDPRFAALQKKIGSPAANIH